MKNLLFKKIRYKNLMSVGNEFIEIELDKHKKTLITGKNGSAKSTMLEALHYALFDSPFRKIKKGQLVNSVNNKNLLVELEMQNGSDEVFIRRGQKPTVFEVTINGQLLEEEASKAHTQEKFESYLGLNPVSFKQVVVLGTAGYKPFMELTTPERRKLVEDMLDLSVLARMDKLNKERIREINEKDSVVSLELNHANSMLQTLKDFELKQQERVDKEKQQIQEKINTAKTRLTETEQVYEKIKTQLKDFDSTIIDKGDSSIIEMIDKIKTKQTEVNLIVRQKKQLLQLHSNSGGKCPICNGSLDTSCLPTDEEMDKLNETIIKLDKVLQAKNQELQAYNNAVSELNKLESTKTKVEDAIKVINDSIENLETELEKPIDVIDNSGKIKENETKVLENQKIKSDLVVEKYRRGIITEQLKDSGIKAQVVSYYIPYLNKQINEYLRMLEADYNFTLDSEFNEEIKSIGRSGFSYHSFSQGEKARIDISMLFSWRDIASKVSGVNINLLVLDEVTDGSTDEQGVKTIQRILNSLDSNIFIISHREHNPEDYGCHIQMKKVGRFSVMQTN